MVKFCICVMKIMIKLQTIILFIIRIMQLISQNHCLLCLYIFNKHFISLPLDSFLQKYGFYTTNIMFK